MVDIDTSIAATHMMLQAWAEGIGSCWITWFDPAIVKKEFALPDTVTPVNILVLGYAQGASQSPERHKEQRIPLADMVWNEALPGTLK